MIIVILMRMLSLVSGWYPHYLVMGKAYDAVLKYYIERPNDRLGLNHSELV